MILQRLKEFAARVKDELPPLGYDYMKVKWRIELGHQGKILGAISLGKDNELTVPNPNLTGKRSSGDKAGLLADSAEYALGKVSSEKHRARALDRHGQFVVNVSSCDSNLHDSRLTVLRLFLEIGGTADHPKFEDIQSGDNVVFSVDGTRLTDIPQIADYWVKSQKWSSRRGMCMLCGEMKPLVDLQPVPIKGIPGGQPSGAPLISANTDAFESYGLANAQIAPMCLECAHYTHHALNYLIRKKERHSFRLRNSLLFVYWTREPVTDILMLINFQQEEAVAELLTSALKGRRAAVEVDPNRFYASVLTAGAGGGRIIVKDWIDTTVQTAKENQLHFFDLHKIRDFSGKVRFFSIYQLGAAALSPRQLKKDEHADALYQALFRLAVRGDALPQGLLSAVVQRCRTKQTVPIAAAALIRLILLSKSNDDKGELLMALDRSCDDPGYVCGRLLALFARTQDIAHGRKVGSSVVDRYYGTASVAPATVFPGLMRLVQHHISKINSGGKGGLAHNLTNEINEAADLIKVFPKVLSTEEQGKFALGYYHQRSWRPQKDSASESAEQ